MLIDYTSSGPDLSGPCVAAVQQCHLTGLFMPTYEPAPEVCTQADGVAAWHEACGISIRYRFPTWII
jgi:hypothetical protein